MAWTRRGLLLAAPALLAACASTPEPGQASWSGRLALQVQSEPPQSFSAAFTLRGAPSRGDLSLTTPLGSTIASLAWEPGTAVLRANGEVRRFDSIDALSREATGTALPLAALFDWLAGRPAEVPGWQADLSRIETGRLVARRASPAPSAELRIVLDPAP